MSVRKVGERKRKGYSERVRDAENALRLLFWEVGLELDEGPPAWCEDEGDRQAWIEWIESSFDEGSYLTSPLVWIREALTKKRAEMGFDSRIRALRNVKGRMPQEAAAFLKKADELERKRRLR
jgi:hypothetical protein